MEKVDQIPVLTAESEFDKPVSTRQPIKLPSIGPGNSIGAEYVLRQLITGLPLIMADALALVGCGLVWSLLGFSLPDIPTSVLIVVAVIAANGIAGLYPAIGLHPAAELHRCSIVSVVGLTVLSACLVITGADAFAMLALWGAVAPVALVCIPFFRSAARQLVAGSDRWAQPVIIFGAGKQSAEIYRAIAANRKCGLRPLGFVDEIEAQWVDASMDPNWYLGTAQDAVNIAAREGVYWAVVSVSVDDSPRNRRRLELFASTFPHRLYAPGALPHSLNRSAHTRSIGKFSLLYEHDVLALPIPRLLKRFLDLSVSLAVAVLALPLMLVIGLLIKISSRGSIFYAHQRIGRNHKPFNTLKFRTMRSDAAQVLESYLVEHPELRAEWNAKHKLLDDPRVTPLGRLLRKSSLDELPQLFNVLKGEMSLVGPRPIVESEIARYDDAYELYCRVPPGVAGLWQVSGRNNTTYEERVDYDRFYVQHWSLWLDIYLLARTVKVVLTQDGAC